MAVKFLTNLNLNGNQLLNARLQVLASDPGTAVAGDIIYNSSTNVFKFYNGTDWIDPSLGGISGSGTAGTIPIFTSNAEIGNSDLQVSGTGSSSNLEIAYPLVTVKSLHVQADLRDTNDQTGAAGQLLSSKGSGNGIDWIDAPVSYTKWVLTGDTGTQDILDGNTVLVAGGTNITTAVTATDTLTINASTYNLVVGASIGGPDSQLTLNCTPGTNSSVGFSGTANQIAVAAPGVGSTVTTFSLPTNVTIPGDLTVGGGDITLSGTGRIQGVDTVTASTDAASKAYVDSSVAGGLTVKGGFLASNGAITTGGNLTSGASRVALAVGDYYVVTGAGDFFGNAATPLTVGDSVLVQTAAAAGTSVEGDFAIIQSDTDLATLTNVGLGNVNIEGAGIKDGLSLNYSAGTAKLGLDITSLPNIVSLNTTCVAVFADPDDTNLNFQATVPEIATGLNSLTSKKLTTTNQTTHTFTHNLNTFDVIVQLYDTSSKETVYANVDRTNVNQVVATTSSTASLTCLIDKIG